MRGSNGYTDHLQAQMRLLLNNRQDPLCGKSPTEVCVEFRPPDSLAIGKLCRSQQLHLLDGKTGVPAATKQPATECRIALFNSEDCRKIERNIVAGSHTRCESERETNSKQVSSLQRMGVQYNIKTHETTRHDTTHKQEQIITDRT